MIVKKSNKEHHFDLIYVSHICLEENIYKYVLKGVDLTSRYKFSRAFMTKKLKEVAFVLKVTCRKDSVAKYHKLFSYHGLTLKVT